MPPRLLLDEMFPRAMADQLNTKGHDVRAVVADPGFIGLPDEDVLIGATEAGRALVTANIKDFMPIDARYRGSSRSHAGLVMVSSKTFPQHRGYVIAVTSALDALLATDGALQPGGVVFLSRSTGPGLKVVAGLRAVGGGERAGRRSTRALFSRRLGSAVPMGEAGEKSSSVRGDEDETPR